jgi:ABC-type uncharacterized transport system substrate-binding protein
MDNPAVVVEMREAQAAARTLGLDVVKSEIRRPEDIALSFDALKGRVEALYVVNDHLSCSCAPPFGPAMLVTHDPNRS